MTLIPGVCYVCGQPKADHTAAERSLGCQRPLGHVPRAAKLAATIAHDQEEPAF